MTEPGPTIEEICALRADLLARTCRTPVVRCNAIATAYAAKALGTSAKVVMVMCGSNIDWATFSRHAEFDDAV